MNFTGERLMSSIGGKIALEHLHRYAIAQKYIHHKEVLDLASGEGYGSNLLASRAKKVYGVDIDKEAVEFASKKYRKSNLEFLCGSAVEIPLPDKSVDVVVSFETIEHLAAHQKFMDEVKRVLRVDGMLIISSPDKEFYTIQPGHKNEFHVKELYEAEFQELITSNFRYSQFFWQGFAIGSVVYSTTKSEIGCFTGDYENIQDESPPAYQYNIAICSDSPVDLSLSNSLFTNFNLFSQLEEEFNRKIKSIYNSKSYRIGNFLVTIGKRFLFKK